MKSASLTLGAILLAVGIYGACASGDSGLDGLGGGLPTGSGGSGATGAGGYGGDGASGGGDVCVDQCSAHFECASTCAPAPVGSSNCCDTQTHVCYLWNDTACPSPPPPDGGTGGSSY